MFETLLYLYETYRMAQLAPDRDTLEKKLFAAGFDQASIKAALDWFAGIAASETSRHLMATPHFRHFAAEELECLDDDCIATLRLLEEAGMLDPTSREWVINGLMQLHGEDITPELVRWMSLIVLWGRGDIEHFTLQEEYLLNESTLH